LSELSEHGDVIETQATNKNMHIKTRSLSCLFYALIIFSEGLALSLFFQILKELQINVQQAAVDYYSFAIPVITLIMLESHQGNYLKQNSSECVLKSKMK